MKPRPDVSPRFVANVAIASTAIGGLTCSLEPLEPRIAFQLPPASLTLTLWADADATIRVRLEHEPTGSIAYLQSNTKLLAFGRKLGMIAVTSRPE
jgi:hypothetical protein